MPTTPPRLIEPFECEVIRDALRRVWFYLFFGLLLLSALLVWPLTPLPFIALAVFAALLALLTVIDLKHFVLPDLLTYSGLALGLVLPPLCWDASWANTWLGGAVGFGFFFLLSWGFEKVRGYPGLGFGDVKFLAMLGAWVGALHLPLVLLISALSALPVLILRRFFHGTATSKPLPYGPFLALGGYIALLFGPTLWQAIHTGREALINQLLQVIS